MKPVATLEAATTASTPDVNQMIERYRAVRRMTLAIIDPLETEDMVIQTAPDVSPTKWHLAHASWFFERFLLAARLSDYQPVHPAYNYLFNSYYNAVGPQHCRPKRGLLSRPTVREVLEYRRIVDQRVEKLLRQADTPTLYEITPILTLGLNHEQQHQELIVTDIKHVLSSNPLLPSYASPNSRTPNPATNGDTHTPMPAQFLHHDAGVYEIGVEPGEGFSFDNESPRHRRFLEAFEIASHPVINAAYLAFIEDGGYERPELWLSMGWAIVQQQGWRHPIYWYRADGKWMHYTMAGPCEIAGDEPACHLSYFEADAFARWAHARLPTEAEWEVAAPAPAPGNRPGNTPAPASASGNPHAPTPGHAAPAAWPGSAPENNTAQPGRFADDLVFHPARIRPRDAAADKPIRMFGDVWEWTSSSYSPYPGYAPTAGALGEYNGKFMCNQYVLRGGSCATHSTHIRPTYRNFFPPDARWQFTGLRLARSA